MRIRHRLSVTRMGDPRKCCCPRYYSLGTSFAVMFAVFVTQTAASTHSTDPGGNRETSPWKTDSQAKGGTLKVTGTFPARANSSEAMRLAAVIDPESEHFHCVNFSNSHFSVEIINHDPESIRFEALYKCSETCLETRAVNWTLRLQSNGSSKTCSLTWNCSSSQVAASDSCKFDTVPIVTSGMAGIFFVTALILLLIVRKQRRHIMREAKVHVIGETISAPFGAPTGTYSSAYALAERVGSPSSTSAVVTVSQLDADDKTGVVKYTKHGIYRSGRLESLTDTNTMSKLISQSASDLREDPFVGHSRHKTEMNTQLLAAPSNTAKAQFLVPSSNTAVSSFQMSNLSDSVSYESFADDEWTCLKERFKLEGILLDPDEVTFGEELGQGVHGIVYAGSFQEQKVAVKVMRLPHDELSAHKINRFLDEARVMQTFNHPNLLSLIGVCLSPGGGPQMVMPLMSCGSLQYYLRSCDKSGQLPSVEDLSGFALQVAYAMDYLADNHYVHRDLAARNCMLGENMIVKVSDFGLGRFVDPKKSYYTVTSQWLLPIRWMAPESLEQNEFSTKSDVWSFGVLLWEIFTLGQQPYGSASNEEVAAAVLGGHRLKQTDRCPLLMFLLMEECWHGNGHMRPPFSEIIDRLERFETDDYENMANPD